MLTINFEMSQDGYTLKDAIVLPNDHNLTDDDIESLKQQRFDEWYAIVTAPQPEYQVDEILEENGMPIEVVEVIEGEV
jgi:hypothetical protein